MRGGKVFSAAFVISLLSGAFLMDQAVVCGPKGDEVEAAVTADLESVARYRRGLRGILDFVAGHPETFRYRTGSPEPLPNREKKETIRVTWKTMLDYYLALDSIRQSYRDFLSIRDLTVREDAFIAYYAAFLAQYSNALEFLALMEGHEAADVILNEPVPELGLPGKMLARYKLRYLNVAIAAEFAALEALDEVIAGHSRPAARKGIAEDAGTVWKFGEGKGELMTVKNALTILKQSGKRTFFPLQSGVARLMGDIRFQRGEYFLITPEEAGALHGTLKPGDVLLQRREWFLSNVGLPGFWTHAALYIGTAAERREYFGTPAIEDWVRTEGVASGDFEDLLGNRYPVSYRISVEPREDGHLPRVLEAVGEGVIFTTLEHSGSADSMAVLRPRLPLEQKARALLRAFHYSGRPYDFDFDFMTDAGLVCSELIYKAYETGEGCRGLRLPLKRLLGRPAMPPNEMARLYDEEYGSDERQFDLVIFLDGFEKGRRAVESTAEAFRESWRRPKWHVIVQEEPPQSPD